MRFAAVIHFSVEEVAEYTSTIPIGPFKIGEIAHVDVNWSARVSDHYCMCERIWRLWGAGQRLDIVEINKGRDLHKTLT